MKDWQPALKEILRVARRKVMFSHLIGNKTRKCGRFQWCTTYQQILEALGEVVKIEEYKLKQIMDGVDSIYFVIHKTYKGEGNT